MRQFLVERKVDLGLYRITVFDDERKALKAYEAAEKRELAAMLKRGQRGASASCVLLGADRLGTLLRTHGTWFDEPARDLADLVDAPRIATDRSTRSTAVPGPVLAEFLAWLETRRPAVTGDQA